MTGIGSWVSRRAVRAPEAMALIDGRTGESTNYRDLDRNVAERAATLGRLGVRRGDRVALLSSNSVALMETMFAVVRVGGIFVPINYRLSPDEVAYILDDSRPTILAHDSNWAALAADALSRTASSPTAAHLDELLSGIAGAPEEPMSASDLAMIMYTSGTTGYPKGAMLTHGNFQTNADNMLTAGVGITPADVAVIAAPMFHIGGLGLYGMPLLYAGGTAVIQESFDPTGLLTLIERHRATLQFLVPAMWAALTRVPNFDDFDVGSLRALLCGGAPCPIPVIEFFADKGLTFLEGFGMTELAPTCMVLEPQYVSSHAGSVGRPFMSVDVRIVDEQDHEVETGEVGELTVRGDNVFVGYWGLPAATAEAKRGGWFHTGDLARSDDDGFVTLVDRKKDMIVTGGENVYPIEVEQILYQHPDVVEAAVIGVPDAIWGEAVTALIVIREGAEVNTDEIVTYCRGKIAAFKTPKRIEFISALPRNATGKILKRDLREQFTGRGSAVSR